MQTVHLRLLRKPIEHGERLAIGRVLAAQHLDTPLHWRVEVLPSGLVRQGEVPDQQ